jgi:hypothetical protein
VGKAVMKSHSWLNFLVFTCFLVIGYSFSARFYAHGTSILPETPRVLAGNENSIDSMPNGQRSLLLISTSSLDTAASRLESIWLVSYIPSESPLRIMPVYPSSIGQATPFDDQLRTTFKLTRSNGSLIPDQAFLETLQSSNYWWSGYFIFDAQAFSSLVSQALQTSTQGNNILAVEENGNYLDIFGRTTAGSSVQLGLLQSACQKFFKTGQGVSLSQLLSLLPGHYLTDLQPELIQQEWDSLYSGEQNPTCRFPTLEISRLGP